MARSRGQRWSLVSLDIISVRSLATASPSGGGQDGCATKRARRSSPLQCALPSQFTQLASPRRAAFVRFQRSSAFVRLRRDRKAAATEELEGFVVASAVEEVREARRNGVG